jgi:hypothetical protein
MVRDANPKAFLDWPTVCGRVVKAGTKLVIGIRKAHAPNFETLVAMALIRHRFEILNGAFHHRKISPQVRTLQAPIRRIRQCGY